MHPENPALSSGVSRKISSARGRRFLLRLLNLSMALLALALILAALAMLFDWVIVFRSAFLRLMVSLSACVAFLFISHQIWRRLKFREGIRSTANWLDEVNPALEERLSTVVELDGKTSHSPEMLKEVSGQADQISIRGGTRQIVFAKPFLAAIMAALFAISLLGVVKLVSGPGFSNLFGRLFLPFSGQTLTDLPDEAMNEVHVRGRLFEVRIPVTGKVPGEAMLEYRQDGGATEQRRIKIESGSGFIESSISRLNQDFVYRVIAGDDETPWNEVRVVDHPQFERLKLVMTPPSYTKAEAEEWTVFPKKIEAPEGSKLVLTFSADQELSHTTAIQRANQEEQLTDLQADQSGKYHFQTDLTDSQGLEIALISAMAELQSVFPVKIAVISDQKPSVELLDETETFAMKAEDVLAIKFKAIDDYGIESAEVVAEITRSDGTKEEFRFPIDLGDQVSEREVQADTTLDLEKLPLTKDSNLTFSVEVRDERGLQGQDSAEEAAKEGLSEADGKKLEDSLQAAKDLEEKLQAAKEANEQALAAHAEGDSKEASASEMVKQSQKTSDLLEEASELAQAVEPAKEEVSKLMEEAKAAVTAARKKEAAKESLAMAKEKIDQALDLASELAKEAEENLKEAHAEADIELRKLDVKKEEDNAARSGTAQVTIEEFADYLIAGSGGKKEQIAIQEVLDLILESAQTGRMAIAKVGTPQDGENYKALLTKNSPELVAALQKGMKGAEELLELSAGTPYSFFGIQAKALVETGFQPALEDVKSASGLDHPPEISKKLLLADERLRWVISLLEKNQAQFEKMIEYEEVLQLAHKFKKMHQITIEDMPPDACDCRSGPYPKLKMEYSDEAIQQLIAKLKLKREALKRLSELLENNPALRARYLAQSSSSKKIFREELSRLRNRQNLLAQGAGLLVPGSVSQRVASAPKPWNELLRERLSKFSAQTTEALGIARIWIPTEAPTAQRTEFEDSLAVLSQAVEQLSNSDPLIEEDFVKAVDAIRKSGRDVVEILEQPWWQERHEEFGRFRMEDFMGMTDELEACEALAESLLKKEGHQFLKQLQEELNVETRAITLGMMESLGKISGISPKADETIEELEELLFESLFPSQKSVIGFLNQTEAKRAMLAMNQASSALEKATKLLDSAIVEALRTHSEKSTLAEKSQARESQEGEEAQPLPDPSEEAIEAAIAKILSGLEEESRKAEILDLGISAEKNYEIKSDWEKPSSGDKPKSEKEALERQKAEQMRAAKKAINAAAKAQQEANQKARELAKLMEGNPASSWEERQLRAFQGRNDWNTIPSQLTKSLTQDFDTAVPEEFRDAIDEYFRIISKVNEQESR